jgi:hypothetical protein
MTATRPRRHGKRAFLTLLAAAGLARAGQGGDPGWRLTVVPSYERPALHESITGSGTALVAAARHQGYDQLEYATTRGAWQRAAAYAEEHGDAWLTTTDIEIRRDGNGVIDRVLIRGNDPLLPALALAPAFYDRFEPMLGPGFHVIIPDRGTIALYPRVSGTIPPAEAAALLRINRFSTFPVSREVFRAARGKLEADGILEE